MLGQTQPTATFETITPEIARDMLTHNTRNRTANPRHMGMIAANMMAGTFHLTADPIRFGADGTLYDGQHRLMACVAANVAFQTLVVRDLPADTLLVIDGGLKRSKAQQLEIATLTPQHVSDCAMMLIRMAIGAKYHAVSTDTLAQIIQRHPTIAETATAYKEAAKFGIGMNFPAGELILRANGYQQQAASWRDFWTTGTPTAETAAIHHFREEMIRRTDADTYKATRWTPNNKRALITQAIIRHAENMPPTKAHYALTAYTFPCGEPEALLTTTSFDTDVTIPVASMTTIKPSTLQGMRGRKKSAHADQDDQNDLPFINQPEQAEV